jgi:fluoride exporter
MVLPDRLKAVRFVSKINAGSCNQAICDVASFPVRPVSAMAFFMTHILLVAVGGAFGSVLRYLVGLWALRGFGPSFPWGTLTVNVTGSFLIGVLAEVIARKFGASTEMRVFLITGILGGYTTFSAFSLDAITLLERGEPVTAAIYVGSSVLLSTIAVFAGLALMRAMV